MESNSLSENSGTNLPLLSCQLLGGLCRFRTSVERPLLCLEGLLAALPALLTSCFSSALLCSLYLSSCSVVPVTTDHVWSCDSPCMVISYHKRSSVCKLLISPKSQHSFGSGLPALLGS